EADRRAFRTDSKELAEHAFAVDSVVDRLEGLAAELEVSPEPFVLRLPGLEHLASDVSARLRGGATSLDVASRLHPSAAVSGTPREQADEIITELEPHDRGGYASPVGWMDAAGDGQWAIALRMAHLVDERTVVLQAGGGLVAASDPVSEHAEALAKCRPMLRALRGERDAWASGGARPEGDLDALHGAVPHHLQLVGRADLEPSHHTGQGGGPVHGGVVDGDDEVALAQRGVVGWAARLDADHLGAAVDGAVGRCAAVGAGHADEGVVGGAVLTQLVGDHRGGARRDREAQPDAPGLPIGVRDPRDRGVDADHLAGGV